ncbi:hypothetical protein PRCB_18360 [Pantoea rodasii]|uniref:DUF2913 domain-containing protein n=1 Tax=Pantoea rodasii TaxID=1076549 RepID=A0A2M9W9J7_9GAMM|nr:DUF2913 family protein [Pantoea rodasii]ORM63922.1 hypothetical protein HA45_12405 [Pantoea rodasii]PJZ04227.1 hypothetical protein PRCB_18360 [Pantoea rodasii]
MDTSNLYVDHLAWCGLIALNMARQAGTVCSAAQENLFLCRWLAAAEKKRLFRRELANDIRWLLRVGREKGLRADLPGKLEYLWRASSGDLLAQNDLFRLQHVMHTITLTGINYGVLTESEWEGRHAVKLSPKVPGVFLRKYDLENGFGDDGRQNTPLAVRFTADLTAVDALLKRAGWQRQARTLDPLLHHLFSGNQGEGDF